MLNYQEKSGFRDLILSNPCIVHIQEIICTNRLFNKYFAFLLFSAPGTASTSGCRRLTHITSHQQRIRLYVHLLTKQIWMCTVAENVSMLYSWRFQGDLTIMLTEGVEKASHEKQDRNHGDNYKNMTACALHMKTFNQLLQLLTKA